MSQEFNISHLTFHIIEAAHKLMERAQEAGCLHIDGHVPSREERALCAEIRDFTRELKRTIEDAAPEDLYRLTTYYDMLYRVGFHEVPSQKFRDDMMHRFFESWMGGNESISEAEIYALISPKVRADAAAVDPRYYSAYYKLKTAWTRELNLHDTFRNVSPTENYSRLMQLIADNLSGCYPGGKKEADEHKQRWVRANLVADPTLLDPDTRESYRRFLAKADFLGFTISSSHVCV